MSRTWPAEPTLPVSDMRGVRSGVNGTPTFYINGARHDSSYDVDTLVAALERAADKP